MAGIRRWRGAGDQAVTGEAGDRAGNYGNPPGAQAENHMTPS